MVLAAASLHLTGYESSAMAGGSSPATLRLTSPGASIRAPGSVVPVEVVAADLSSPAVGVQVFIEWDATELSYQGAADGDSGFVLLRAPAVMTVPESPNLRRLALVTGRTDAGQGVTSGVLGRVSFTVAPDALVCSPETLLAFGPDDTIYSTKLTTAGGVEIPFTGESRSRSGPMLSPPR
jgi:hypothetical protein